MVDVVGAIIGVCILLAALGIIAGMPWMTKRARQSKRNKREAASQTRSLARESWWSKAESLDRRLTGSSLSAFDAVQFEMDGGGRRICLGKGSYGAVRPALSPCDLHVKVLTVLKLM